MSEHISTNEKLLEKPIIIFGTGRSGTTIISDIIFQHEDLAWHSNFQELFPKYASVNILRSVFDNKFWRLIGMNTQNNKSIINYICFRPIERYNFWEEITGPRIEFSRSFLVNQRATDVEKNRIRSFFVKMVKYQQRKRLAFKLTGPSRMEYLSSIFPDALYINIVREPVATVRSWLEVQWSNQITDQLWWTGAYTAAEEEEAKQLAGNPALFAAFQYKKIMQVTDDEIKKVKPSIFTVSYEDFVSNPNETIKNILEFLKLKPSKLIDNYINKINVSNRNNRQAKSSKTNISEETRSQILQMINS